MALKMFTDSQTALRKMQLCNPGPDQAVKLEKMKWDIHTVNRGLPVDYGWIPTRNGIKDD